MEKQGLGPAHCAARNPGLVYGRMIGWGQHGQHGQLAQAAGHDLNYVPLTGLLSLSAHRGQRPIVPPTVVGDANGALGLAFGIACAAASRRQRPGMRCGWSVEQQDIQAAHRMRAILLGYQCGDAARSKSACAGSLAGGHRPRLQRSPCPRGTARATAGPRPCGHRSPAAPRAPAARPAANSSPVSMPRFL